MYQNNKSNYSKPFCGLSIKLSESGKKADLGTMTHKVMEVLAGLKKFQQDNSRKKYLVVEDDAVGKVRIHNVALTASECLNDFNQQKSIYGL